ncbi:TetR/AcrR family transcriptional regulator [Quadrisphaera sp. RL12-1S]|nr:TetR/AcrR family transcriptional regulator [Quadrisphaera sp. RL12-1S]MBC3761460.1 TetR/AcrR family transcriptional regulator [Quadrisphaera sp. RL12-1S]
MDSAGDPTPSVRQAPAPAPAAAARSAADDGGERATAGPVTSGRGGRRKARTRQALLRAGQQFLAEGRTAVSIQEVTEAADVGFGTFYGHFQTKEELFEAAALAAVDDFAALLAGQVPGGGDPALTFITRFRLAGRLQRQHPLLVRVVLGLGPRVLTDQNGMLTDAATDIEAAQRAGRFDDVPVGLALTAVGGVLLGLLQLLDTDPQLEASSVVDDFAERVLRMLGLPAVEAHALARTELFGL